MVGKGRRSWGTIRQSKKSKMWRPEYTGTDGVVYCSGQHQGKPATFQTKAAAAAWLAEIKKSIDLGTWKPPTEQPLGLTVREYSEYWLTHRTLRPRTNDFYQALLRNHILPTFGDVKLTAVTPTTVWTWYAGLQTGPTAQGHAYGLLRSMFVEAVASELVDSNPCRIRNATARKRQREIVLIAPAELHALADAMKPPSLRAAVLLLAWCGLRIGEVLELRRHDVRPGAVTIRVERAVIFRSGTVVVGPPKTDAGVRTVVVPPHIRADILAHLDTLPSGREVLLFGGAGGKHVHDRAFRTRFKTACAAVDMPDLRVHDLRHFGATLAAQSGATLKELMARIGHATPEMALRYQSVAAGRDAEIAERMSKRFGDNSSNEGGE